jgi:hypothetical protein
MRNTWCRSGRSSVVWLLASLARTPLTFSTVPGRWSCAALTRRLSDAVAPPPNRDYAFVNRRSEDGTGFSPFPLS